ncbi:MAG: T9SS type A sorting domain-containing protein [Candidatus Marinimicrobia bacterium]|nr:T9SS type A sorting domain-containing protein [Candidatus Neomarinimicrobiota bacterium]
MIKRSIFLLSISFLMGQNLLDEHFNNASDLPDGWEFIPENYPSNTGQWQISSWNTNFNNNAPSATYYWSPSQPNTFANPYDGHYMYSPIINVGTLTTVIIRFQIALDGYPSPAGHYNGMNIEYSSDGGDWVTALNYEISAGGGQVDIMPRTESFFASMDGTLQLRWETYGTNSYYIDAWHVDDVRVDVIPSITNASISSNNTDDNQKAIPGDIVSLEFTLPNDPDPGSPFVLINSTEVPITNPSGLDYVAAYTVPEDATDGPISFLVDFTSDGVSGPTCRNTTDDTNVLVDVSVPAVPTVTDNVISIGEDSHPAIWSSTDTQVQVDVLVPNDTTVIGFDYVDGNSLSFQGNSGQVTIPWNDVYLVSNEFTIEAYINVNSAQNYEGFLDFGNYGNTEQRGFGFFLYSGGWRFYLKTTGTQKTDIEHIVASASVNTWVHFAARFQNGDLTLYRDGIPVDFRNDYVGPVDWSGFSDDLILGSFDKTSTKFFDGKIDEVRLWNVARDENLIKAYKAVALNGDEDGLIGYWRLDEGSPATTSIDLSTTNNSANLENGVEWVQDSPFFFQEDVLDPYSIIGSKFQILSKILDNDLIPIGERIVITEDHSIAGEISLTAPSDDFEGIQDFAHELEGQFSARLFDQAGNYEDGNISSTTLPIDIEANEPIFVSMTSNNTFSHLAKTGDILTISITHDEDVNIPAVTINGNDGDESDLGGEQFQISYTLLGTEPEGEIGTLQSIFTDYLGNDGSYNGGSIGEGATVVNYDRTLPTLDQVTIISNNINTQWAMVGDQVTVNATASEVILSRASTIQSQSTTISDVSNVEFNSVYEFLDTDVEGLVVFNISFSDSAGNSGIEVTNTTNSSWVVFDKTPPEDFNTGNVISTGGNQVGNIWNSTNTGINISVPIVDNDTTIINGKIQVWAKIGLNAWEQTGDPFTIDDGDVGTDKLLSLTDSQVESITGFAEEDTITFKTVIRDRPGNEKEGAESINRLVIEQTLPSINYVSYRSNFSDTTLATVGHEITLTLITDEAVQEPIVNISGQNAGISDLGNNKWTASYIMQDGDSDGIIPFEIGEILDIAGNPNDGTSSTTDGSTVTFDNIKPTLDVVRISSNNSDSTWSKIGDMVSLVFIPNELLTAQVANIVDQAMVITDLGSEKYLAEYEMTEFDPEGQLDFEIFVTDSVGLESDPITETTNSSNVIFDRTLPTLDQVSIQSNNLNNTSIGIAGDDVILTFMPIEPLLIDSMVVTIANENITLLEDGEGYVATLTLTGDEPGGILPFSIDFQDRASNRGLQITNTLDDSYVNHDIVPPEILTASMYSNNQDTTWSKPGDTVFVKFSANEALDNLNILIAGNSSDHIDDGAANYRGFHIMDDDDVEGGIIFSIEYTDLGGATGPTANSTTDETIVRYDRTLPQLSNIRMSSNNAMIDSAAIGDMDSLFFTVSEAHRNIVTIIEESNVVPTQVEFEFIAVRELVDEDPDGLISFSIIMEDSAGNSTGDVTETNDGSFVWFDGTRPTLASVSFHSTNENDPSLAIVADTLVLDFESSEPLSSISVSIAQTEADTIFINETRSTYRSWYILDGNEAEGFIPFQIAFFDLVGNSGDAVSSTTDESSILFDITPPIAFAIDSVYVIGGNAILGYWNTSNDSIIIKTPISLDDESLIGGAFQPMIKFEDNEFFLFGDEIEIGIIPEVGYELLRFSRNNFESVDGYAENLNAQFTTKIIDKAGNETLGSSDGTIIHIDETIPTLDSVTISTNNVLSDNWATTSDTVSLLFRSSEGLDVISSIMASDTVIINGSMSGTLQIGKYVVNIFDPNGQISFDISFADTAGNQGVSTTETTDGTMVGIDNTSPSINALLEGYDNLDPTYYNNSDTITLYWNVEDTTSGIRETYYALGSEPNVTDVVDWTMGGVEAFGGWSDLGLENNNTYHGAAFVRDSAGNYSDTIWGNGVNIDTELPTAGTINDGQWILEMDYTPDSTSLEYLWDGFSDNIGIDHFELSIGTNNDTINIQDWYQTDSIDNVMIDGLDLDRDTLYYTYIKAVDSAYNYSSAVRTDGIYFDDSEPKVMVITPDFSDSSKVLSVLSKDSIKIKFNRLIYFYDLKIRSSADSSLLTEESYSDSVITITWDDTLTSNDTLTVYLDSALAYNSLFVSETLYFFSHLWGDLNYDYDLTVEDILQFNRSWPEIDLGPFLGSPPHIRPTPDGQANLTDLSSFAKMWQWRYFNLSLDTLQNASRIQDDLSIIGRGSHIEFTMPEQTCMAEILVGNSNLNIEKMNVIKPTTNTFLFKSIDSLHSIVQFSLADHRGLDSSLKMTVPVDQSHSLSATIQYRFLDNVGNLLSSGIDHLDLDLLPEKFIVYDNYPNPFNPITTIRYEIPDHRDIKIKVIDIMGRTIKSVDLDYMMAGRHAYVWNGTNDFGKLVSTGIYFLQINAGPDTRIKKMLLLK